MLIATWPSDLGLPTKKHSNLLWEKYLQYLKYYPSFKFAPFYLLKGKGNNLVPGDYIDEEIEPCNATIEDCVNDTLEFDDRQYQIRENIYTIIYHKVFCFFPKKIIDCLEFF